MKYKPITQLILPFIILFSLSLSLKANKLLIKMDETQTNHLKAYGLCYWILDKYDTEIDWLLNYKGGSFLLNASQPIINECIIRNISYDLISEAEAAQIIEIVKNPDTNTDVVKLQKIPKIAVYTSSGTQPWDDAVTLALTYAEIPYDKVFDKEVLEEKLPEYDWLHLHHEDFTGQFGKFNTQRGQPWYMEQVRQDENTAAEFGFNKVSKLKLAVVKKIKGFVAGGGYMFAMCNATDTFDIALAAEGIDIVPPFYDGDGFANNPKELLDYNKTFAFTNFDVVTDYNFQEFSSIDHRDEERGVSEANDYFNLFEFSAKYDPIPTLLTQNHKSHIKGFMGQTTAYKNQYIKPEVVILAENRDLGEARYLHGTLGKGFWSFYGGHDPEDYKHFVNEEPTDMNLHPNSAAYRLILNNVLFPAAKKKKLKT